MWECPGSSHTCPTLPQAGSAQTHSALPQGDKKPDLTVEQLSTSRSPTHHTHPTTFKMIKTVQHTSQPCVHAPFPPSLWPFLFSAELCFLHHPDVAPNLTTQKLPPSCLTFWHASGQQPWLGATLDSSNLWLLLTLILMPGSNLDFCGQRPWGKAELRERQELHLDTLPPVQGISASGNKASDHGSGISHCNLCALVSHLCLIGHNLVCKQDLSFSMP